MENENVIFTTKQEWHDVYDELPEDYEDVVYVIWVDKESYNNYYFFGFAEYDSQKEKWISKELDKTCPNNWEIIFWAYIVDPPKEILEKYKIK